MAVLEKALHMTLISKVRILEIANIMAVAIAAANATRRENILSAMIGNRRQHHLLT